MTVPWTIQYGSGPGPSTPIAPPTLDVRLARPYLAGMAHRLFLTLLALLTGLAAQNAPAQARVQQAGEQSEIGATLVLSGMESIVQTVQEEGSAPNGVLRIREDSIGPMHGHDKYFWPTVRLRVDRARE